MSEGQAPQPPPTPPRSGASTLLLLGVGAIVGAAVAFAVARSKSAGEGAPISDEGASETARPLTQAIPSAAIPEPMFTVNAIPLGRPPADEGDAGAARAAAFERSVREERVLLEAVRGALDKGDGAKATELLERHGREFADGLFGPDARILRIEALSLAGRDAEAVALAREFLEAYPHSPQADRVRILVANLRARTPEP